MEAVHHLPPPRHCAACFQLPREATGSQQRIARRSVLAVQVAAGAWLLLPLPRHSTPTKRGSFGALTGLVCTEARVITLRHDVWEVGGAQTTSNSSMRHSSPSHADSPGRTRPMSSRPASAVGGTIQPTTRLTPLPFLDVQSVSGHWPACSETEIALLCRWRCFLSSG